MKNDINMYMYVGFPDISFLIHLQGATHIEYIFRVFIKICKYEA